MNKQQSRLNRIVSYLQEFQMSRVADLAQLCDVSEVTIRRDLKELQDNGVINHSQWYCDTKPQVREGKDRRQIFHLAGS